MEKFFKSDLEKRVWIGVFTRVEAGVTTEQRMINATKLVLELRNQLQKLLQFGSWVRAASDIVLGTNEPEGSVFKSDLERDIWISAFTRPVPEQNKEMNSTEGRAKRAWGLVLEFREPTKDEKNGWEQAVRELAGG